jgi:hypothetical protein
MTILLAREKEYAIENETYLAPEHLASMYTWEYIMNPPKVTSSEPMIGHVLEMQEFANNIGGMPPNGTSSSSETTDPSANIDLDNYTEEQRHYIQLGLEAAQKMIPLEEALIIGKNVSRHLKEEDEPGSMEDHKRKASDGWGDSQFPEGKKAKLSE